MSYAAAVLLGRDRELARIGRMLDEARGGSSGSLIVHGDPGVGKTALLDAVADGAAGFTVLRARGLQAESELPFAGLADLLRPLMGFLDRIPPPQSAVLSGALAIGPPTPGDRFAAAAATISLLAAGGEATPVLAVIDDAQWLDTPSREALLFASRRLGNDRVAVVLATRDSLWRATARLPDLELRGLDPEAAGALVARSGRVVGSNVRDRLVADTAGNPLAIIQALSTLRDDQLSGSVPITGPIAVGRTLEASFARRLASLPPASRRALLVAAASDTGDLGEIQRALGSNDVAAADLDSAESLGVVAIRHNRVEFVHPLLRSAAYHVADPVDRRWAHRSLAGALGQDQHDQIAWHLAAATTGRDEAVARRLEETAVGAQARHGYIAAANALATAASLSPESPDRLRRMLNAGNAFRLGGQAQTANDILLGLVEEVHDPLIRADAQLVRGSALIMIAPMADTTAMLIHEATLVQAHDPARAASMLAIASIGAVGAAQVGLAVDIAGSAVRISQTIGGPVQMVAELASSFALTLAGRVGEARALIEPLLPMFDLLDPLGQEGLLVVTAGHVLAWIEDWEGARRTFDRMVSTARRAGAVTMLPHPLAVVAEFELRCGRIAAAYSAAGEAVEISADIGEAVQGSIGMVALARIEALLGLVADGRAHAAAALEAADRLGLTAMQDYASGALGMLELSLGRPDRALAHLETCSRFERDTGVGLPNVVLWNGDLIETYVRLDRHDDAARELEHLDAQATATGIRWAAAVAARCRGLLATDDEYPAMFARAIELHGAEDPYELGRTQLCFGRRLRHSRRRAEARVALGQAAALFDALGAGLWAEQSRIELRASGGTPSTTRVGPTGSLTPQELHVALTVAAGATNKEAAAALFISAKTVEFHLGHIYRKLGLRSRSELARHLVQQTPGPAVRPSNDIPGKAGAAPIVPGYTTPARK